MARRGKVKYKDVVKKTGFQKTKKIHRPKQRKTYSLYKKDYQNKSSENTKISSPTPAKKRKIEEPEVEQPEQYDSSSEEDANELHNLINTFKQKEIDKKSLAIESSESDDSGPISDNEHEQSESDDVKDKISEITTLDSAHNDVKDEQNAHQTDENVEAEIDLETQTEDDNENSEDPFTKHLFYDLSENLVASLQNLPMSVNTHTENWPLIGNLHMQIPKVDTVSANDNSFGILEKKVFASAGTVPKRISKSKIAEDLFIKSQIVPNLSKANSTASDNIFTPLQAELFSVFNNYNDVYFPQRTFANSEEIRFIYSLHAVNHVLKTRIKIIHHNAKLSAKEGGDTEFRDQGLVRPKVRKICLYFSYVPHR